MDSFSPSKSGEFVLKIIPSQGRSSFRKPLSANNMPTYARCKCRASPGFSSYSWKWKALYSGLDIIVTMLTSDAYRELKFFLKITSILRNMPIGFNTKTKLVVKTRLAKTSVSLSLTILTASWAVFGLDSYPLRKQHWNSSLPTASSLLSPQTWDYTWTDTLWPII